MMWISKKKYTELEKRIADLEVQVQSQQIAKQYYVNIMKNKGSTHKKVQNQSV